MSELVFSAGGRRFVALRMTPSGMARVESPTVGARRGRAVPRGTWCVPFGPTPYDLHRYKQGRHGAKVVAPTMAHHMTGRKSDGTVLARFKTSFASVARNELEKPGGALANRQLISLPARHGVLMNTDFTR